MSELDGSADMEQDMKPSDEVVENSAPLLLHATNDWNGEKKEHVEDSNQEVASVTTPTKDELVIETDIANEKRLSRDDLSDDSNSPGFLGFPADTLTDEEKKAAAKKKQEKPKLDLLVFDSSFGKGKRSRIPNKKYESLTIKSFAKSRFTDEGPDCQIPEDVKNSDSQDHGEETQNAGSTARKKSRTENISTVVPYKKQKMSSDMTNPNFMKPFQFGWKRELVYRATLDLSKKRNGDIYYYTPTGKKIRSMRELSENMVTPELTLEDFTFWKEPVGVNDPDKEIIREAKMKGNNTPSFPKKSPAKTKIIKEKEQKIVSTPKFQTPVAETSGKNTTKSTRLGGFKVKISATKLNQSSKPNNKKGLSIDNDSELDILPTSWSPNNSKKGANSKPSWQSKTLDIPSKTRRGSARRLGLTSSPISKPERESQFMHNYLQNLSYGYQTLLYVFQYLKVQDLLRAGCVCTLWRDIASHPSLWKTVRMKNSQVANWEGLADALKKHRTETLDLRKMLLPTSSDDMWPMFSETIARVDTLVRIELCRCPASVIEQLPLTNKDLQVINAVAIRCESLDLINIDQLRKLQELRLKSTNGFTLKSDLSSLSTLSHLNHLSITSVKDLYTKNVPIIANLINLQSLELGECTDFPENFGSCVIAKLKKLEKLRLEKGQGTCDTFNILEAVSHISTLEQLELVNFDIKVGFDKSLSTCTNIKKLLIIPTYISQSATTNHMVLGGVMRLKSSLSHFVWGVTLELLRVTELFVDQCDENPPTKDKKKSSGNGDSIPVLKPVPILKHDEDDEIMVTDPPQVEILPLPTLQKLLLVALPTTRVKILKIPFHATWRQSIVDTVN